ncbi:MAG: hypothetical protein ACTSP1_03055, partial [Candidatus Freyarchaeota archaeon]
RYLTNHPGEPPRNESETPPESHKQAPLPTPHPSFEQYWPGTPPGTGRSPNPAPTRRGPAKPPQKQPHQANNTALRKIMGGIDGDGKNEVIAGSNEGTLKVFDFTKSYGEDTGMMW